MMLVLGGCAAPALAPEPEQPAHQRTASAPGPEVDAGAAGSPPDGPDTAAVEVVDDEIVCRYVKSTGSNIREKQCFTRKELVEMSAESRDFLRTRGARGAAYRPPDPDDPRSRKKE